MIDFFKNMFVIFIIDVKCKCNLNLLYIKKRKKLSSCVMEIFFFLVFFIKAFKKQLFPGFSFHTDILVKV